MYEVHEMVRVRRIEKVCDVGGRRTFGVVVLPGLLMSVQDVQHHQSRMLPPSKSGKPFFVDII